jgi:hypothetical protein
VRAYKGWLKGQPYLRIYRGDGIPSTTASNVGLNSFLPPWARIGPKSSVVAVTNLDQTNQQAGPTNRAKVGGAELVDGESRWQSRWRGMWCAIALVVGELALVAML